MRGSLGKSGSLCLHKVTSRRRVDIDHAGLMSGGGLPRPHLLKQLLPTLLHQCRTSLRRGMGATVAAGGKHGACNCDDGKTPAGCSHMLSLVPLPGHHTSCGGLWGRFRPVDDQLNDIRVVAISRMGLNRTDG